MNLAKKNEKGNVVKSGQPMPLGARWDGQGVNFALYSRHARRVTLCLFNSPSSTAPARVVPMKDRHGPVWHAYVAGLGPGQLYGYRVDGPFAPRSGHRYNPNKVLLDPYARAIGRMPRWDASLYGQDRDDLSMSTLDSAPHAPLGVVTDAVPLHTERPHIPWEDTIIYETHVKGISRCHPEVPPEVRGTFLGLISSPVLGHLKRLGVTAVELLPVHAAVQDERLIKQRLAQYWGYNTLSFFALDPRLAAGDGVRAIAEFQEMVRSLHAEGIEVILDVVYNHTGEGEHLGPTLSFRGLDNYGYYKQRPDNSRFVMDYTGCGNTLDTGNAAVRQLIMDSLRYWVQVMGVDGFRFDLASVLARERYEVNMQASMLHMIHQDPVLRNTKLIAEPWDAGRDGYQLGAFPWRWSEWNDRYRDTLRRFWRGDPGMAGECATRLAGSSDRFARRHRRPCASVNFVTSHDGFTLEDLVSYSRKYNEANKEGNRDGSSQNYSTNCGVEGSTQEVAVLARRDRLKRSMFASLLVSQGVPMILGGDELSRTQRGNNNPYCQDNVISWYDWTLDARQERFLDFARKVVALRRAHPNLRRTHYLTGQPNEEGRRDVTWWHPAGREMKPGDWSRARCFAMQIDAGPVDATALLLVFNAASEEANVVLPAGRWRVVLHEGSDEVFDADDALRMLPSAFAALEAVRAAPSR